MVHCVVVEGLRQAPLGVKPPVNWVRGQNKSCRPQLGRPHLVSISSPCTLVGLFNHCQHKRQAPSASHHSPTSQAVWVGVHSARANAMAKELLSTHCLTGLPDYDNITPGQRCDWEGLTRVEFNGWSNSSLPPLWHSCATYDAEGREGGCKQCGNASSGPPSSACKIHMSVQVSPPSEVRFGRNGASRVDFLLQHSKSNTQCHVEVKSVTLAATSEVHCEVV